MRAGTRDLSLATESDKIKQSPKGKLLDILDFGKKYAYLTRDMS